MSGEWDDRDLLRDVEPAQWIRRGLGDANPTEVRSLVPAGFDQYARVLNPAEIENANRSVTPVRWADVARASGGIAHAGMQFAAISAYTPPSRMFWTYGPRQNNVSDELASRHVSTLARLLAGHTKTPETCFYGFWEGNTAFSEIDPTVPRIALGSDGFRYYMLGGPISRAGDNFHGLLAHLWWPADRAWFVAAHFDFDCIYVGGSARCIDDLIVAPDLESWQISPDHQVMAHSDRLNPLPPSAH
ncbi:hypothetical protein [Gordonia paraffinivorans]|uniref:hypothetical protein n=1 Tax=Gordonia paraffinivorans TaxID=175628 RepID=UPI001C930D97|nr:hypothetical protein [Gordonia paraffinivorans]